MQRRNVTYKKRNNVLSDWFRLDIGDGNIRRDMRRKGQESS